MPYSYGSVRSPATRVKGVEKALTRLRAAQLSSSPAIEAGVKLATAAVVRNARRILGEHIYGEYTQRGWLRHLTGSLERGFRRGFERLSETSAIGTVTNIAPEAVYVEFGTDDEGTGTHDIRPSEKGALAFEAVREGEAWIRSKETVHGLTPFAFMRMALDASAEDIREAVRLVAACVADGTDPVQLTVAAEMGGQSVG